MFKKARKAVIFDFDGTLANTFQVMIDVINQDPSRYGIDGIDPTEIPKLRNLSVKYLISEFGINLLHLRRLARQMQSDLFKEINSVVAYEGIFEVVEKLKEMGFLVGIVTSNNQKNVKTFLKNNQSLSYFDFIRPSKHLFGKHKTLNKVIKKYRIDRTVSFYVGDEVRDIEAAKKANLKVISVPWGFNDKDLLSKHDPDFIVETPKDILSIVKEY